MYTQLLAVTLRVLAFRAGPQDYPYAPALTPQLLAFALLTQALVLGQLMPLPLVLLIGVLAVGALALATRTVLRSRNLDNRFHQTLGALLATGGLLTLAMAPLFSFAVPMLREVSSNPEILEQPEKLMALRPPAVVNLLLDVLFFWNLAVTARIYRLAGDLRLAGALLTTLAVVMFMFLSVLFGTALLGGLFGLQAQ